MSITLNIQVNYTSDATNTLKQFMTECLKLIEQNYVVRNIKTEDGVLTIQLETAYKQVNQGPIKRSFMPEI